MKKFEITTGVMAKVYIVNGSRRFFTLKAAISHMAWKMIKSKSRLNLKADDYRMYEYRIKLHNRLVRFLTKGFKNKK